MDCVLGEDTGGQQNQSEERTQLSRRDYKTEREELADTLRGSPALPHPPFLIEPSVSRILGHTCFLNQGMENGIVLEEMGQRGQVQTGRVLDFGQGQPGLWDRPAQGAPTGLWHKHPLLCTSSRARVRG